VILPVAPVGAADGVFPFGRDLIFGFQRGAAAEPFSGYQDQAVEDQEHRGVSGLAEDHPEGVLEHQANQPDRDRGQDD
jgi:hypothetical protein